MVKISSQLLDSPTRHLTFQDIAFHDEFDGVWASASLLHIPYDELFSVMRRLHHSLKTHGIMFVSFKYGEGRRQDIDGRIFYDLNETTFLPYYIPSLIRLKFGMTLSSHILKT